MINKLPCLKDKCLLLPICKPKFEIRCNNLYNYLNDNETKQYRVIIGKKLNIIFSKCNWITHENSSNNPYFIANGKVRCIII